MRTCLPCPAGERWRIRRRRRYGHSVEATVGRSFRTPAATPSPWRGLPARARKHVRGVGFSSDVLLANLETHRVMWGLRPRLSLSSELRFGVNPGATLVPLQRRLRRLPIA